MGLLLSGRTSKVVALVKSLLEEVGTLKIDVMFPRHLSIWFFLGPSELWRMDVRQHTKHRGSIIRFSRPSASSYTPQNRRIRLLTLSPG